MAKVKQKKSVQELLQEAIIPNNQAPFPIPDNWCWTKLGCFSNIIAGGTPSRSNANFWGKGIPWVKISDMTSMYISSTEEEITEAGLENSSAKILKKGTLLFSIFATIGSISILDIRACTNQAIVGIILPTCICKEFIYYSFLLLKDTIIAKGKGVAQKNINQTILKEFHLPIAPFEEQKRIVDKIESLFSKLDEAKELIQKSFDEFENRKAAILYKAIHGQLIKKTTSWNKVILKDVVYEFQYGTSKKSEKKGKAIVIRMGNLQAGKIDWNDLAYSNDDEDILKYKLQKGDVLFNRTNSAALVGKTSIYEDERLAIFAGYLIRLKYDKNLIIGRFLNYLLNSQDAKEYCSRVKTDAVNQSNINAKKIAMFSFMLPSLEEQQEIVRILDSFFEKEDKSKELLDMIAQIEEMKKSILSRAFRGELGTHSDDDEPAIELLKKII